MKFKKLMLRIKMAWKAFWLIPFEVTIENYKVTEGKMYMIVPCDNHIRSGCNKKATKGLYKTNAVFEVNYEADQYLLCDECAKKAEGTKEKIYFNWFEGNEKNKRK